MQRGIIAAVAGAAFALGLCCGSIANKANPAGTYQSSDGTYSYATPCPDAPLDASLRKAVYDYCMDHPGSSISAGLHKVDCTTPPNPPNLRWGHVGNEKPAHLVRT